MALISVYNLKNEKVEDIDLSDDIFAVPVKNHILHQVVTAQLAAHRRGTSSTKGRSEVSGSTIKLFKQKGTGRARAGSASSPTRYGGGKAFGPSPRSYVVKVPKKVRKVAIKMALSDKVASEQLKVIASFELPDFKTKNFVSIMKNFDAGKKSLIVVSEGNDNIVKSSRNVPWIKVLSPAGLNVYDILNNDCLFLEKTVIGKIVEALSS